jgi:hypothetical protein
MLLLISYALMLQLEDELLKKGGVMSWVVREAYWTGFSSVAY